MILSDSDSHGYMLYMYIMQLKALRQIQKKSFQLRLEPAIPNLQVGRHDLHVSLWLKNTY